MFCPEELAAVVSAAAIAIAKGRTTAEIAILSAVFVQIGDTLGLIAVQRDNINTRVECCCGEDAKLPCKENPWCCDEENNHGKIGNKDKKQNIQNEQSVSEGNSPFLQ